MALETAALNIMADSIKNSASLTLQAWDAVVLDSQTPTFDSAVGGVIDLNSNVEFTLTAGESVATVRLYSSTTLLGLVSLTTNNSFPAGGQLIVTRFEITVA